MINLNNSLTFTLCILKREAFFLGNIEGCFRLVAAVKTWPCWSLFIWLHRAGVLFHKHLSVEHNIRSVISHEQRWPVCSNGFGKAVWKQVSRPHLYFMRRVFDITFESWSSEDKISRQVRKSLNPTTSSKLSFFSYTLNFHCRIQKGKLSSKVCSITV